MQHSKKILALALTLMLLCGATALAEQAPETVTVTLLETCDLHGFIASYDYAVDKESSGTGLTRIATLLKQEREKDPDLLLMDCGDCMQGNMISLFNGDLVHPIINAFNLLQYDIMTLGNHEFNYEFSMLSRALSYFDGDVIMANAYTQSGERWQQPYVIKEVKGVKIGVFGVNAPHITRWEASAPEHFNNMTFTTPMEETGKMVAELRPQVDVLIGLVHYGRDGEYGVEGMTEVAAAYPEVDAFFIGHAHEAFAETLENGVAMLEPGANGSNLGKLTLTLAAKDGKYTIVDKTPELLATAEVEEDAELKNAMLYVHEASVKDANTVVGEVTGDFLPSLYWKDIPGIPTAQIQDTALVDLINTVQMRYSGADVSLAALFTDSANLTTGEYKKKDAVNVYKYDNTLMGVKVTGAQLKAIMEQQAGAYFNQFKEGDVTISFNPEMRLYTYDMFAGVDYEIDISKPVGERIVNLVFKGTPLEAETELVLALNNYRYGSLVSSGLLNAEDLVFDSTIDLANTPAVRDLISVYAQEMGGLTPVCDDNWRIVGADLSQPEAETIYQMVRDGALTIPTSEDGRTVNIQSLNVFELKDAGLLPEELVPAA